MTDKHKISIRFFTTAKCGEDDANSNLKTQKPQLISDTNQLKSFVPHHLIFRQFSAFEDQDYWMQYSIEVFCLDG